MFLPRRGYCKRVWDPLTSMHDTWVQQYVWGLLAIRYGRDPCHRLLMLKLWADLPWASGPNPAKWHNQPRVWICMITPLALLDWSENQPRSAIQLGSLCPDTSTWSFPPPWDSGSGCSYIGYFYFSAAREKAGKTHGCEWVSCSHTALDAWTWQQQQWLLQLAVVAGAAAAERSVEAHEVVHTANSLASLEHRPLSIQRSWTTLPLCNTIPLHAS